MERVSECSTSNATGSATEYGQNLVDVNASVALPIPVLLLLILSTSAVRPLRPLVLLVVPFLTLLVLEERT